MMKRIIGIIIALSLISGIAIPIPGALAAQGISHEREVSLLSALDIVPGYPDPSYKEDDKVKAEAFVRYAYALTGVHMSDVSAQTAAFSLDGGADIKISEAAEVIARAVGYDAFASGYGGSLTAAMEANGLMKGSGVTADSQQELTKDVMAVMLSNALELKAVKIYYNGSMPSYEFSDEIIMEHYLDVYKEKGNVNASDTVALGGYDKTSKYEVRIDDEVYNVGRTDAKYLIGCNVDFYYRESHDDDTIVWIEPTNRTERLIVYGEDVESISDSGVKYLSGTSKKTARLENAPDVIYNGESADGDIDLLSTAGSVSTLIDTDGNGKYDVIDIKAYTYYFIDGYNSADGLINDYKASATLDISDGKYDEINVYENGSLKDISALRTGILIAALENSGSSLTIEVVASSVEGSINAMSETAITIAGTEYSISPLYYGDNFKLGMYAVFYLDLTGKVIRAKTGKAAVSSYGYIINMYEKESGDGTYRIKLLMSSGAITTFEVDSKVVYNGRRTDTSAAYNNLIYQNGTGKIMQLITYDLNTKGEISKINSADTSRMMAGSDEVSDDFAKNYAGSGSYRKANMCFNSKYTIDAEVPIFLIPYNEEQDDYQVTNLSYLTNNYAYNIEVYDIDEYMRMGALVLRENMNEPENLKSKRAFVVTRVTSVYDEEEGESGYAVEGYMQGAKTTYMLEREDLMDITNTLSLKNLSAGDVMQVSINSKNRLASARILFREKDRQILPYTGSGQSSYWEGGRSVLPDLYIGYGNVVSRNSEVMLADNDGDESVVTKRLYRIASGVNVFLMRDGSISVISADDIQVDDMVYAQEYTGNTQDVVVYRE